MGFSSGGKELDAALGNINNRKEKRKPQEVQLQFKQKTIEQLEENKEVFTLCSKVQKVNAFWNLTICKQKKNHFCSRNTIKI